MAEERSNKWLRRILIALAVFVGLVVLAVVVVGIYLSDERVANMITESLEASLGRKVTIDKFDLRLFSASATVEGLTIHEKQPYGSGPMLSVDSLDVSVRVLPLLFGEVEVESLSITSPKLQIVLSEYGLLNVEDLSPSEEAPESDAGAGEEGTAFKVESITLENGQFTYIDHSTNQVIRADGLNLIASIASTAQGLITAQGSLGGGEVSVAASEPVRAVPNWSTKWDLKLDLAQGSVACAPFSLNAGGVLCEGKFGVKGVEAEFPEITADTKLAVDLARIPWPLIGEEGLGGSGQLSAKLGVRGPMNDLLLDVEASLADVHFTTDGEEEFVIGSGTLRQAARIGADVLSLDGGVSLTDLGVGSKEQRLASLDVKNKLWMGADSLNIENVSLTAPGASFQVSGKMASGTEQAPGPLDLHGSLKVSLPQFVELLVAELTDTQGELEAEFSLSGTSQAPEVHIKAQSERLALTEAASNTRFALDGLKLEQNTKGTDPANLPIEGSLSCNRLRVVPSGEAAQEFKDIRIDNRLIMDSEKDALKMDKVQVSAPGVEFTSSGAVNGLSSDEPKIALSGKGSLDLAKAILLARPFLGMSKEEFDAGGKLDVSLDCPSLTSPMDLDVNVNSPKATVFYSPEPKAASGTRYTLERLKIAQSIAESDRKELWIEGSLSTERLALAATGEKSQQLGALRVDNRMSLTSDANGLLIDKVVVSIPGLNLTSSGTVSELSSDSPALGLKGKAQVNAGELLAVLRPFIGVSKSELDAGGKVAIEFESRPVEGLVEGQVKVTSTSLYADYAPDGKQADRARYTLEHLDVTERASGALSGPLAVHGSISCKGVKIAQSGQKAQDVGKLSIDNRLTLNSQADSLGIEGVSVSLPGLQLALSGAVEAMSSETPKARTKGSAKLNLGELTGLIRHFAGLSAEELQLDGSVDLDIDGQSLIEPLNVEAKASSPKVLIMYKPKETQQGGKSQQQEASRDPEAANYGGTRVYFASRIGEFHYNGVAAQNQIIEVLFENNRLDVRKADMNLVGGSLENKAAVQMDVPGWQYEGHTKASEVDLVSLSEFIPYLKWAQVTGKVGGVADFNGRGTTMDSINKHLSGQMQFEAHDGQFTPGPVVSSVGAVLGLDVLQKPIAFRTLTGKGTIEKGRLNIAAIDMKSEDLQLHLEGGVWLDGRLDLDVVATLSERLSAQMKGLGEISALRGTKLRIPFKVKGTLGAPKAYPDIADLIKEAAVQQGMGLLDGFLKKK